jgi:hypothetical protein
VLKARKCAVGNPGVNLAKSLPARRAVIVSKATTAVGIGIARGKKVLSDLVVVLIVKVKFALVRRADTFQYNAVSKIGSNLKDPARRTRLTV